MLAVTMPYAGVLALWYVFLTINVIRTRGSEKVNLGTGESKLLERRVRAHGNFAEFAPFCLILMGMAEISGLSDILLHVIGGTLLIGRLAHGWALSSLKQQPLLRAGGMILTLISLLVAAVSSLMAISL